jgi:hypothetical protein
MLRQATTYFEKAGEEGNTLKCLDLALGTARRLGIRKVVVASTSGMTAVRAGEVFKGSGIAVIAVAHQFGHRDLPGKTLFRQENMARALDLGVRVNCGTDLLTATVAAVRERYGGGPFGIVADTLRMFCQGAKVAVECAVMACDAGLVSPDEEIVSVAGTSKGADTVLVLQPAETHRLFTLKIREIVAKPR